MQQRALARTGLADDREELAATDFDLDAAQHGDLQIPFAIRLLERDAREMYWGDRCGLHDSASGFEREKVGHDSELSE